MLKKVGFKSIFALALATALSGCAQPQVKKSLVFYPPAPNPPRMQYLTSISSDEDIEGKKDSFSLFAVGKNTEEKAVSIRKPYGVTVHKGKIYVCDIAGKIVVVDPEKKKLSTLDTGNRTGMKKPTNVAFDDEDNMYVSDVERKEILVFNAEGKLMKALGKDEGIKPSGVAVDDNFIYVLDLRNSEVKRYDKKTGTFVDGIGKQYEVGKGLGMPTSFTLNKGFIYATNIINSNVVVFDRDGNFLKSFGELGDRYSDFARPKGVAVDSEGRIYVVDNGMQQVKLFSDNGRILMVFGGPGFNEGDMNLPVGVAVTDEVMPFFKQFVDKNFDAKSLVFVTNQYGDHKLAVYALGYTKTPEAYEAPPAPKGDAKPAAAAPAAAAPAQ